VQKQHILVQTIMSTFLSTTDGSPKVFTVII